MQDKNRNSLSCEQQTGLGVHVHVLMRDEKEEASRPICCLELRELWFIDFIMYMYMYIQRRLVIQ